MLNRIIIMGRLVRDPELRTTQSGTPVTSFTLAVDRDFKSRESGEKNTDFIDVVAWRQTAEFVSRFFTKGKPILVSGQLQNSNWTDNNGVKHYSVEIVADEVTFVERKSEGGSPAQPMPQNNVPTYGTPTADSGFEDLSADDELPF